MYVEPIVNTGVGQRQLTKENKKRSPLPSMSLSNPPLAPPLMAGRDNVPLMAERPVTPTTPSSTTSSSSSDPKPRTPVSGAVVSLISPPKKKKRRPKRFFLAVLSVFRSFPVFTVRCSCGKLPPPPTCISEVGRHGIPGTRVTGTLFGYRKGKVSLAIQDAPKCMPNIIVELAIQTHVLFKELGAGMVRLALECEKKPSDDHTKEKKRKKKKKHQNDNQTTALLDEPIWTVFCNGKRSGVGVRREPTEEDLAAMGLLHAVSMGAGVLPGKSETEGPDGEVAYMRAGFDHIIGSRDSETLYLVSPDGGSNGGPDLTIFFVRV